MKIKIISLILLLIFSTDAFCQINIIETANKENSTYSKYDSTYNFGSLKNTFKLIGQTIYFLPYSNEYKGQKNKYSSDFLTRNGIKVKNPQKPDNVTNTNWSKAMNRVMAQKMADRYPDITVNTYKPVKDIHDRFKYVTPTDSIIGKYYKIIGIVENPHLPDNYRHDGIFFDLVSINNPSDSLLFQINTYDVNSYKVNNNLNLGGNYIVQGYYEKLNTQFINKKFIYLDSISEIRDVKTGEVIHINTNPARLVNGRYIFNDTTCATTEWKCVSVSLAATQSFPNLLPCLILKNGNKTIAVNLAFFSIQDIYRILNESKTRIVDFNHHKSNGFTGFKENGIWKMFGFGEFKIID